MHAIELREFEGRLVAIFPDELLEELHVDEGDTLYLYRSDAGWTLARDEPAIHDTAMRIYRRGSEKYRNTLRALGSGAAGDEPDP